ncbi:MAG TPA: LAGLIDADG family homing endonuclease [Candidatus Paceibacterota bacterium]|nr:LAGLIDADG family homing endonuclease [Candidatus Paceibacterota bacterium]
MGEKLPGDYIAGFVDGEGCFYINFRRDVRHDRKNKPVYFYWKIGFAIVLRDDDKEILENIKQTLSCGIIFNRNGQARLQINNLNDLVEKVVPFFDNHVLRAKKKYDYVLWKEALNILQRNRQTRIPGEKKFSKVNWNDTDLKKLQKIKSEMEKYKSRRKPWKWLL